MPKNSTPVGSKAPPPPPAAPQGRTSSSSKHGGGDKEEGGGGGGKGHGDDAVSDLLNGMPKSGKFVVKKVGRQESLAFAFPCVAVDSSYHLCTPLLVFTPPLSLPPSPSPFLFLSLSPSLLLFLPLSLPLPETTNPSRSIYQILPGRDGPGSIDSP